MSSKYAILIGINGYHESLGRLKYCVNDVRRLADVLTQGEDAFPTDRLLVLTDDGEKEKCPTYANIHSWLASYLAQVEDDDIVFVYFAGHGREHGGKAYLLPCDATLQTLHVTGIPVSYVQELLERCKARQKVLVLDACHSGAGRDVAAMSTGMLNELSGGKGIYTITSCDAAELSHEWNEKKHGVFSYFLSEALAGGCPPDAQNRVTAEVLYEWVYDRVRNWARKHRCTQTPKRFSAGSGAVVLGAGKPGVPPAPSSATEPGSEGLAGPPARNRVSIGDALAGAFARIQPIVTSKAFQKVLIASLIVAAAACLIGLAVRNHQARDREDKRILVEARLAVETGDPSSAIRLLAGREMLRGNRPAKEAVNAAANRLLALQAAERAAAEGDVPRVAELVGKYRDDPRFRAAMTEALDVGEEKYQSQATNALADGDYLAAAEVCRYYEGRASFDLMMTQANEKAREHIRRVAPAGNWEAARKAIAAFPEDEELAALGKEAKRIFDRPRLLQEAKGAAAQGHVEQVRRIVIDYPGDADFAPLVAAAQEVWSNDLARAERAAQEGDIATADSLWQKHNWAREFGQFAAKAKQVRRATDLSAAKGAMASNEYSRAMSITEAWRDDKEFRTLRQQIFTAASGTLPRLHAPKERPSPARAPAKKTGQALRIVVQPGA